MHQTFRSSRQRGLRPSVTALEERALLNAAMPRLDSRLKGGTEVFDAKNKLGPIVPNLPALPTISYTTIPSNGDLNPYGLAVVPAGFPGGGVLHAGDYLVANFNDKGNTQGTGTTIVYVTPGQTPPSTAPVFFTSQATGLSEALGVLRSGFVIVGNVPTTDGMFDTIGAGSIQIIDRTGTLVATLSSPTMLDGPWASAINDHGNTAQLFVSNVLGGTVERLSFKTVKHHGQVSLKLTGATQIASGYTVQPSAAAVVLGPGGLAYNPKNDTLYVAATGNNAIYAIPHASRTRADHGTGKVIYQDPAHLFGPIGLALAPNGDLLTTNDDAVNTANEPSNEASELIEFTPSGQFVGELSLDPGVQGAAFQVVALKSGQTITVATVNDGTNSLDVRTVNVKNL